jgi:hypothetical protein
MIFSGKNLIYSCYWLELSSYCLHDAFHALGSHVHDIGALKLNMVTQVILCLVIDALSG